MPEARIKSKLPIEIVVENNARHHTSVRKPRSHAIVGLQYQAPMSARAVAVIRPTPPPPSSLYARSFSSCLANASCTLVGTNFVVASPDYFWVADDPRVIAWRSNRIVRIRVLREDLRQNLSFIPNWICRAPVVRSGCFTSEVDWPKVPGFDVRFPGWPNQTRLNKL
jgi:hypothetical protein